MKSFNRRHLVIVALLVAAACTAKRQVVAPPAPVSPTAAVKLPDGKPLVTPLMKRFEITERVDASRTCYVFSRYENDKAIESSEACPPNADGIRVSKSVDGKRWLLIGLSAKGEVRPNQATVLSTENGEVLRERPGHSWERRLMFGNQGQNLIFLRNNQLVSVSLNDESEKIVDAGAAPGGAAREILSLDQEGNRVLIVKAQGLAIVDPNLQESKLLVADVEYGLPSFKTLKTQMQKITVRDPLTNSEKPVFLFASKSGKFLYRLYNLHLDGWNVTNGQRLVDEPITVVPTELQPSAKDFEERPTLVFSRSARTEFDREPVFRDYTLDIEKGQVELSSSPW